MYVCNESCQENDIIKVATRMPDNTNTTIIAIISSIVVIVMYIDYEAKYQSTELLVLKY